MSAEARVRAIYRRGGKPPRALAAQAYREIQSRRPPRAPKAHGALNCPKCGWYMRLEEEDEVRHRICPNDDCKFEKDE